MADNWLGLKIVQHLKLLNENIVGMAVHPAEYQNYSYEIISESGLRKDDVLIGVQNPDKVFIEKIKNLNPDIILVIYWRYLLPESIFSIPTFGCINFHMAYLPYNRGKNPNVWPIIENTPAGVTMHYIDAGIDTGKIVSRKQVNVDITDTAKTLYQKQLEAFVTLFKETWPKIKTNHVIPFSQEDDNATFHLAKDFKKLSMIDLDKKYTAKDLINILRSKTFPPHDPAYFIYNNRKIFISVELKEEILDK